MKNSLKHITENKLQSQFGLEISGLDLSEPLPQSVFSYIRDKFNQYSVLLFRQQNIDDAQQIAFSRLFGELESTSIMKAATNRFIYQISNIDNRERILSADSGKRKLLEVNTNWHIDSSFKSPPALASILSGRQIPDNEITRTEFCSLASGYDCLTKKQKARIRGLTCIHDYKHSLKSLGKTYIAENEIAGLLPCKQPLVHIHPDKEKPCLYLSNHISSIVGMSDKESKELLEELFSSVLIADNVYDHIWQQDDLLIWDNRCIMHRVNNIPIKEIRRVHRTTVKCPSPLMAALPA
ncbi:MAG: TauD/TfdA family dioxygenase [Gammaproteobacteria bacterium]